MNFEVIRPSTYLYDVIIRSDLSTQANTHSIHSNYGYYHGDVDESMLKEGKGVFVYPTCTFIGQWRNDLKNDGILIVNSGYRNSTEMAEITPPSPSIVANKEIGFKSTTSMENQQIINGPGNQSYLTSNKLHKTFAIVDSYIQSTTQPNYLESKDYYQGKWMSSKANGIGSFHFSKDNSTCEDFWRNGVAIRYYNNENQLTSVINYNDTNNNSNNINNNKDSKIAPIPPTSSTPLSDMFSTNEELKKMLEDWKTVVGPDDDFPVSKPYLSSVTVNSGLNNQMMSSELTVDNGLLGDSKSPTKQQPQQIRSPGKSNSSTDSPPSMGLVSSVSLGHAGLSQTASQPIITPNNIVTSNNQSKQSFGVITSTYLKNRLENEEKFFIALILFISRWEQHDQKQTCNFMIVVPDIETASFLPLSTLVMQCTIMEKMIYRLLTDPNTKLTLEAPDTTKNAATTTTPDERELYKLLPFCLDLDQLESTSNGSSNLNLNSNNNQKAAIEPIISGLKEFTKKVYNFQTIPPFLVHHICDIVSVFKKNKPFETFALSNRFQQIQEQFLAILNLNDNKPTQDTTNNNNNNNSNNSNSVSSTTPNSGNKSPVTTSPKLNNTTIGNTRQPTGISSTTVGVKSNSNSPTNQSASTKNIGNKFGSVSSTNSPVNVRQNQQAQQLQKQKTIDNIHQYYDVRIGSGKNGNLDNAALISAVTDKNVLEYLLQLFKVTFELPLSFELASELLNHVSNNITIVKKLMTKKVTLFKETKTTSADLDTGGMIKIGGVRSKSSYREYLKVKDAQIDSFIEQQEMEIELFDQTIRTCDRVFILLFNHLVQITLKRLTKAISFIKRLNMVKSKLPSDYLIRFIKHIDFICQKILSITSSNPISSIDKDSKIVNLIKTFINSNNEWFSLLPAKNQQQLQANSNNSGSISPMVSSASILNGLKSMVLGTKKSLGESFFEPNGASLNTPTTTNSPNKPPINELKISTNLPLPESFNLSILSSINKISSEIVQGNYQHILLFASSGDELLVSLLSSILVETRTNLKDKSNESIQYLINVLIKSTSHCPFKSYRSEVFKTIAPLSKIYKQKDDLYQKFKDTYKTFMEISLKDDSFIFSPYFCMFLANIFEDLSPKSKKEFQELLPLQNFIDLLEKSNTKVNQQQAEILRVQASQILIYLSKYSFDNIVELKNKGVLNVMLELCKHGLVFAHTKIEEADLTIGEFLGAGALAKVHKGQWNGKEIAIKIFNEGSFSFRLEDFLKEVAIMGLIQHPNLLKLEGACIIPRSIESSFMIVTEIMHKGTLWDVIKKNHPLPPQTMIRHALSIAKGLAYLHSIDLIHRDIKASNILVDKNDQAKVGDFGLSRVVNNLNMTAVAGTPKWEAPECLSGDMYTSAADVYSFGMTLYELTVGEEPFPEITTIVDLVRVVYEKKMKPRIPSTVPSLFSSLIKECLSHTPKKRPTMASIVAKFEDALSDNKYN